MKTFEGLTEQEVLALAISLEEEDARIYDDFADGLKDNHPTQAQQFAQRQVAKPKAVARPAGSPTTPSPQPAGLPTQNAL